jgi:hypothetical protein
MEMKLYSVVTNDLKLRFIQQPATGILKGLYAAQWIDNEFRQFKKNLKRRVQIQFGSAITDEEHEKIVDKLIKIGALNQIN